ncbi:MAG TPA: hypothetical protein VFS21_37210 [Roseiflexaceae bacterium]|nr:hypothetical protein [Roseiflexaceae bacterium]
MTDTTQSTIALFRFAPGNGVEYRALFAQVPAPPTLARFMPNGHYTVFGMAEGDDALITLVLDAPVNYGPFADRWETAQHSGLISDPETLLDYAYPVYRSLMGLEVEISDPPGWVRSWREILAQARGG